MASILTHIAAGAGVVLLAAASVGLVALILHCIATAIPDPFDYPDEKEKLP